MSIVARIARKTRRLAKRVWWERFSLRSEYGRIVFVVGCQRSGTTMLLNCFDKDFRGIVFNDDSELAGSKGNRLRLKSYAEVMPRLSRLRSPMVIAKPLLDSQRVDEILEEFPRSHAIWMFRNYRGAIGSSLKKFKGQVENLRLMLESESHWRSERNSDEVLSLVHSYYRPDMKRADAAAIIWIARNQLCFDQGLHGDPRVAFQFYDNMVCEPQVAMQRVYAWLELPYPNYSITNSIHSQALSRGSDIEIDEQIEARCRDLQTRLVDCYDNKTRDKAS